VEPSETSLTHSGWDVFQKFTEIESLASPRKPSGLRCSFASLRTTLSVLENPTCENPNPFANQKAPIKMLPFHGILCIHRVDL
jgi:hypothetical protein